MKLCVLLFAVISAASSLKLNFGCTDIAWVYNEIRYPCGGSIELYGDNDTLVEISGEHVSGKTNEDAQALQISDDRELFTRIPRGIEKFFPNLKGLNFMARKLTSISKEDLEPFPNLLVFVVQEASLIFLDGDLFKYNPKLKYMQFNNVNIRHVGYDFFIGLNDLEVVLFSNNPCINMYAQSPETILEIKRKISEQCPPMETTSVETTVATVTESETEKCTEACLTKIESLNAWAFQEINKLKDEVITAKITHEEEINQLKGSVLELTTTISNQERLLVEIEKLIREIEFN